MPEQLFKRKSIGPVLDVGELGCPPMMDYRVIPVSDRAVVLIDSLLSGVMEVNNCRRLKLGLRKLRSDVVKKLMSCIPMILSNLVMEALLKGDSAEVRTSRSNRDKRATRYAPKWFTVDICKLATELLEVEGIGLIKLNKGEYLSAIGGGVQSTLVPTMKLLKLAKGFSVRDFSHDKSHEVIVLKTKGEGLERYRNGKRKGVRVEYSDTAFTVDARHKMDMINDYLSGADIRYRNEPLSALDRYLVRYFNENFSRGGRLFKAHWHYTPKVVRHLYSIDGSKCVEVDFKACNLYLAYASAGMALSDFVKGDAYTLYGRGMRLKRKGVKTVVLAMLCATQPLRRFPDHARKYMEAGASWKFKDVEALILEKHKAISHLFYTGFGMTLQFKES